MPGSKGTLGLSSEVAKSRLNVPLKENGWQTTFEFTKKKMGSEHSVVAGHLKSMKFSFLTNCMEPWRPIKGSIEHWFFAVCQHLARH